MAHAQRFQHVVVDIPGAEAPLDPREARSDEQRAVDRRVGDAARVEVARRLAGVALLPLLPLACAAAAPAARGTVALPALALAATAAVVLAYWIRRRRLPAAHAAAIVGLALLPALVSLWAVPWLAGAAARPMVALLVGAASVGSALVMAPIPGVALLFAISPLAVAPSLDADLPGWISAAVGALATGLVVHWRFLRWRAQERRHVETAEQARRLETERDAAREREAATISFLGIASHDLRQPVHALGLFAGTLQHRLQKSPDEPLVRNLLRAVDGLERSFNALLDVSKLDAGAVMPRVETFPVRDIFRRLHMQFGGQAELAGLGLRFSPGGKSVTSDAQLLERILSNLVQNAIKHTTRGGVVVIARTTAATINLEVWDTGCGMSEPELPRIFTEFYQVGRGERDRTHGTGMGLAIVKRLAALLGHRLEVASVPGRGTMFRIGVPIGGLAGVAQEVAPADTRPMLFAGPKVVLVIDDEEPIREGLRLLLQEWGYQAVTAADAAQAEQAVADLEGHVDLVLSDVHLHDSADGMEIVAGLRRLYGLDLPAILITGDTASEQVQRLSSQRDPVLLKPVQPRRLYNAVRAALG
jgi:signal transduction histidine kinase/CheY-like chemotaxis protein